jgi:hypothetical protein
MNPEHAVFEVTPAVRLTFSSSDSWATKALALVYAEAQSPAPVPSAGLARISEITLQTAGYIDRTYGRGKLEGILHRRTCR